MIATDQNFMSDVIGFQGVVLVDFWAEWCGPCRMQSPIIDDLEKDYANVPNMRFFKFNVDENPLYTEKYNVMSIPTLLLIKNGQTVETLVGLNSKEVLNAKIKAALGV